MSVYETTYTVLSRVLDNDNVLKGFLLVDNTGSTKYVTLTQVQYAGSIPNYTNAVYDEKYKTLVGTVKSLTDYPEITEDFAPRTKQGLIAMCTVVDSTTKRPIGAIVFTSLGVRYNVSFKKLSSMLSSFSLCNFSLEMDKNEWVLKSLDNKYEFPVVEFKSKPKRRSFHSGLNESKPSFEISKNDADGMPTIEIFSFDEVKESEYSQSAQEKMFRALNTMRKLTPYYWALFQSIYRKPILGYGTMGVTENTLIYDIAFVSSLSEAELVFILIHEVLHITMQHSTRFIGKHNHELWNIACDLYINAIICKDFEISFGGEAHNYGSELDPVEIKTPAFGAFIEMVDETIDFAKDSPETLYAKLLKENGAGSPSMSNNKGGNQNGTQSDSQGKEGQSNRSNGSSDNSFDSSKTIDKGSSGDLTDSQGDEKEDIGMVDVSVTFNGKKMDIKLPKDIMSGFKGDSKEDNEARMDASKKALQRADTKIKMEEEKHGGELVKNAGYGCKLTQRHIEFGLSDHVRWQDIVKKLCKREPKKMFTLGMPNQDYMNRGMTIAARHRIGKPTKMTGLKFCLDVSGSVTETELKFYLSELANLMSMFDVDGELIYWSTNIGDAGDFSTVKDLVKVKPNSTGGTDVLCVFEYLAGRRTVNGRKEPDKVRDIEAIFILTDGCFKFNFDEYGVLFGKKVFWLITGNPIMFDPPFGRVIGIK